MNKNSKVSRKRLEYKQVRCLPATAIHVTNQMNCTLEVERRNHSKRSRMKTRTLRIKLLSKAVAFRQSEPDT